MIQLFCSPNDAERAALIEWCKGKRIVEVGTWTGFTAAELAKVATSVVCVDNFCGDPEQRIKDHFFKGFNADEIRASWQERCGKLENVHLVEKDSLEAAKYFEGSKFDLVFIDGAHQYEHTKADILAWMPLAKVICGHDYGKYWPGVVGAVDEVFQGKALIGPDTLWKYVGSSS